MNIDYAQAISHWESLGYDLNHAVAMTALQRSLVRGTSDLKRLGETTTAEATTTRITIAAGAIILPDDLLLPLWSQFAKALRSLTSNQPICLAIGNIQLPKAVRDVVEHGLKTAPIRNLILTNNRLAPDGVIFLTNVLEENPLISTVAIDDNELDCGTEMLSLVEAARNNTRLRILQLNNCGIGRLIQIKPEMLPALLSIDILTIRNNSIGTCGASAISNCLATNARNMILQLDDNLLNDNDATLIANVLKTNANLLQLSLCGNNFTDTGIKCLYKSVYDDQSLNAIEDSNHTCELKLFAENEQISDGVDEAVLSMNNKDFELDAFPESLARRCTRDANGDTVIAFKLLKIEGRKKMKMLHALQGGSQGQFNMKYLNDVSLKLMPKVFGFVQESGKISGTEEKNLDRLFEVIRATPGVASFCSAHDMMTKRSKKRRLV